MEKIKQKISEATISICCNLRVDKKLSKEELDAFLSLLQEYEKVLGNTQDLDRTVVKNLFYLTSQIRCEASYLDKPNWLLNYLSEIEYAINTLLDTEEHKYSK